VISSCVARRKAGGAHLLRGADLFVMQSELVDCRTEDGDGGALSVELGSSVTILLSKVLRGVSRLRPAPPGSHLCERTSSMTLAADYCSVARV
jgi:hypothetical protein